MHIGESFLLGFPIVYGFYRIKHKVKAPIAAYVDGSGVCPACKTVFHTRIRCLAHLTDSRRPRCREVILSGSWPQLSQSMLEQLEEVDRNARREAQRNGKTHPTAKGSAKRADGRIIGRCTA